MQKHPKSIHNVTKKKKKTLVEVKNFLNEISELQNNNNLKAIDMHSKISHN